MIKQNKQVPVSEDWLRVELNTQGRSCRLVLNGTLCWSSIAALEAQFDQLACTPCDDVTVDVERLRSIDEVGLSVLAGIFRYVEARGGRLSVVGASDDLGAVLAEAGLDRGVGTGDAEVLQFSLERQHQVKLRAVSTHLKRVPLYRSTQRLAQRRTRMADDKVGEVTDSTRAAEDDEAKASHAADRPATPEEEAEADQAKIDPGVAEHYKEMAERGVNQKGEGRIS